MYRTAISFVLVATLASMSLSTNQALAGQKYETREERVEKWKQQVEERGAGEKSRWEIKLRDGQKIKGYTNEIREDSFTLVNWKTDERYEVSFNEIESLEKKTSLSLPAKIAIYGALIAVPVLVLVGLAAADS
jgi:hypothetical protein